MNGKPSDHEPIRVGRPALYMPESIDTCHPKYKRCLTWPGTKAKSAQLGRTRGPGGRQYLQSPQGRDHTQSCSMPRTPALTAPFPMADHLGQTGASPLDGSVKDQDMTG